MEFPRKHRRHSIDLLEINGRILLAKFVKIVNISLGGLCLRTEKRLSIGSQYVVRLEGKGKVLSVKGVVAWSSLTENVDDSRGNFIPIYTSGIQFTDMSPEKSRDIEQFVESHMNHSDRGIDLHAKSGLRLYARIRIEAPEKVLLDIRASYRVKNLSAGGMCIESDHSFEIENRLLIEMDFPEDRVIAFTGRIVSCLSMKEMGVDRYDTGIEFIDMPESSRKFLDAFIAELEKKAGRQSS